MSNQQTKEILEACLSQLTQIQEDSNHLTVDQAWDLFRAIESLLKDFEIPMTITACQQ